MQRLLSGGGGGGGSGNVASMTTADRIALARDAAKRWRQVVLLKGAYTVVADVDGRVFVLPFANSALVFALMCTFESIELMNKQ